MKKIIKYFFTMIFCMILPLSASAQDVAGAALTKATCVGKMFNPITDTDWNNTFPITVMGMRMTSGINVRSSPLMEAMPPICICPTYLFGIPFFGIGVTYWMPLYIAEVERRPGCLSSLGSVQTLGAYAALQSEQTARTSASENADKSTNRMQIHWYEYPVMGLISYFKDIVCRENAGINLAWLTEMDPFWQDDLWGAVTAPENALFATPPAQFACAIDAVASAFDYPLDPLFWCAGYWGPAEPFTGNSSITGDNFQFNHQILAKWIARSHRLFLMNQTTGPSAICFSHPNPIWIKSQYRYNQVGPFPRKGKAITTGGRGVLFTFPPITNVPTQEHSVDLIWQGQQCCVRF